MQGPYPSDFGALDAAEGPIVEWVQHTLRSTFMDGLMKGLTSAGKWPMSVLVIAGGALLFWALARREAARGLPRRAKWAALLLVYAIGLANAVGALVIKPSFNRPAPSRTHRAVEDIAHGTKHASFLSIHSATSFAAVTTLLFVYGWRRIAPWYLAAALVGLSRVYCGSHYPSDVGAGALMGVLIGVAFGLAWRRQWGYIPGPDDSQGGTSGTGRIPDPTLGSAEGRGAGD